MQWIDVLRRNPGKGIQRKAKTHGRIAVQQVEMLAPERPPTRTPRGCIFRARLWFRFQRQHIANRFAQTSAEQGTQALAVHRIAQLQRHRIEIDRQLLLGLRDLPYVLVGRNHVVGMQPKCRGQPGREALCLG
jgi:hypothetical protein